MPDTVADKMPHWLKWTVHTVAETFERFNDDAVPRLAAAMSYFLLLALAPLLLILNAVIGLVGARLEGLPGAQIVSEASGPAATGIAQAASWAGSYAPYVAAVIVVFGAVSVLGQFVSALEVIWKTPPSPKPVRAFVRSNLVSLGLLVVLAVALVGSLAVALLLGMFGSLVLRYAAQLGISVPGVLLSLAVRSLLVFLAAAALFTVAFTVAPSRGTRWRDVLPGALVTAALFLVGESVLSHYLGNTQRFNVFGAFQFFVFLIVWIYYSALVALWGAELTRLLVLAAEQRRDPGASAVPDHSAG